ncbi:uncharacterized protein Z518_08159 [Rhinocladiella mackenziei CBS 650.93]|uniref:Rhinocladiella mackenziei CBS 650.93 unplaced genomic scaffold supercont1.6, whole genome shotgun sequence n=1 Tax=Rhinocladiella mackenziei CBS 650.93 TaxID=1442369 RepID=A0A0D2J006_9EURO|nr:uncharacterized protein Z518_08159 [Rhinocladiella mackenziei CBS 650.93]KIX02220.1 hypothetical protein Z518_08159 [Rhinocladiella mackenziei CBS 650.93]
MNTTVDAALIGKMIHSKCNRHHCRNDRKLLTPKSAGPPTSLPQVEERSPPEFLHCGAWPPPPKLSKLESEGDDDKIFGPDGNMTTKKELLHAHTSASPSTLPDIDESSTSSELGSNSSADEMTITPVRSWTVTWKDLSAAVNSWKVKTDGINQDENGNEKAAAALANVIRTLVKAPYSVLKLLARHNGEAPSLRRPGEEVKEKSPRQYLFEQEIIAEGQARVEITEYIDTLIDHAEFEQGYECVWPLEDYRRKGWAKEMVAAYPVECAEFIQNVHEQSRGRRRDESETD